MNFKTAILTFGVLTSGPSQYLFAYSQRNRLAARAQLGHISRAPVVRVLYMES